MSVNLVGIYLERTELAGYDYGKFDFDSKQPETILHFPIGAHTIVHRVI